MKRISVMFGLLTGLALLLSAQRAAALPTTPVYIFTANNKVLDNPGGSQYDNVLIQQWDWNGGKNQQWKFASYYGYYQIINMASQKVLDVPSGSMNDGTPIQQYHSTYGLNQLWGVTILEIQNVYGGPWNGTWYRVEIYNYKSKKYLDVPGFSTTCGTIIQQYRWNGGVNQQWWIGPY